MARAFVTGGSGFVGGALIEALVSRGDEVVALARSDAAEAKVRALGATAARGDLEDRDALRAGMAGCDVVYHAAAKVDDWGPEAEFERANVEGTQRVIDAARAAGVPRLVHVSTEACLVGGRPLVRVDETRERPLHPLPGYPRTKGMAEDRVRAANGPGLATVIVRPRFVWGRGDTTLLPRIVEMVRSGRFAWFSGGRYPTSTTHVRNAVEGLLLAAQRGRPGETYFVTDGEPVEFRAFVSDLLRTQGVEPPQRSLPRGAVAAAAALCETLWRWLPLRGAPPLTRAAVKLVGEEVTVDDAKARRELGYVGRVPRAHGLAELRGGSELQRGSLGST